MAIYFSLILFPVSMTLVLTLDISVHLVCVYEILVLKMFLWVCNFFLISFCSRGMLFSNSIYQIQLFIKYFHHVSKHSWKIQTNHLTLTLPTLLWPCNGCISVVTASARSKLFEDCRSYLTPLIHFSPHLPSFHGIAPC